MAISLNVKFGRFTFLQRKSVPPFSRDNPYGCPQGLCLLEENGIQGRIIIEMK